MDSTGEEPSGFNQTICPLDYEKSGCIKDTVIHKMLVHPLPIVSGLHPMAPTRAMGVVWVSSQCCCQPTCSSPRFPMQGVTLHALIDSCHSGTVMNLPYNALLQEGQLNGWEEEYAGRAWKKVRAGWQETTS